MFVIFGDTDRAMVFLEGVYVAKAFPSGWTYLLILYMIATMKDSEGRLFREEYVEKEQTRPKCHILVLNTDSIYLWEGRIAIGC